MKIRAFIPDSGYRSPLLSYGIVYFLSVSVLLFELWFCFHGVYTPDSHQYAEAADFLVNGNLHIDRTPVFPLLIALTRAIAGVKFQGTLLVIVQSLVFLVSVGVFGRIALRVLRSAKWGFWATAFYAIWPAYSGMAMFVMTESLTMSFVIFLVWSLLRRLPENARVWDALESGLWLFLLIFLRPHLMCLIPVYVIYWIAVAVKFRAVALRQLPAAAVMLGVCGGSLIAYKTEIRRLYGIDSITGVANANKYYLVRTSGLLRPEMCESPRLRKHLDSLWQAGPYESGELDWADYLYVRDSSLATQREIETMIDKAIASDPTRLADALSTQLKYAGEMNVFYYPWMPYVWLLYDLVPLRMWVYMVFMCGAFVWLIVRRKGLALWTLWLVSASISGSAVVGAMWEWNRLFSPGMPEAIILATAALMGAYSAWQRGRVSSELPGVF